MRLLSIIAVFVIATLCAVNGYAQRWEKVTLPAPYNTGYYLDVFFLPNDPMRGWACDQRGGYVIRTVDGGRTWQGTKVDPAISACHLEYIQFLDANVGYCSGPCGMYKSIDGGATWQSIKPANTPMAWGGWFRNANEGWFTGGGCGYNTFLRTVDGGTTFQVYIDSVELRSSLADPYWDATMPANTLYAVGSGTIWRSETDGRTWEVLAYTGTNAPWHEELAMVGTSILVPSGGRKCDSVPGVITGMRFSPDMGTTWRQFNTGENMFGTFLHDANRGWAAGWAASVYYTSNAGQTWQLRNCGLEGAGTDDIFFQDDNTGWVVGDGVFRVAPALRTQNKTVLTFNGVCPDSAKRDTVLVRNINWTTSPWTAQITGPDAAHFRIVNAPLSTTLASCTPQQVIIEYRPLASGVHNATLTVRIQNPDTALVVDLQGTRRERVAYPADTLISHTVRVGTPVDRTILWRSSSTTDLESIISITRVSGDTTINLTAPLPISVLPQGSLTYFTANVRDTGWTQARFRIRLGPCTRDTFITIRIYGVSPIFTSVPTATVDARCAATDTLLIPISNTGNAPLVIRTMTASNLGPQAFLIRGFVSGRFGPPWTLDPGERDTVRVEYRSQTGNDNATMVIEHDDLTLTRGPKAPWTIALRGVSMSPNVTIDPEIIDLGSMCTGALLEKNFTIKNTTASTASVRLITRSSNITGLPTGNLSLIGGQQRQYSFTYTANVRGPINDTIAVQMQPCDVTRFIIVRGLVEDLALSITPSVVADSADVGVMMSGTFVVKLVAGDSAMVRDIRVSPLPGSMITNIPTFPRVLRSTDSIVVGVRWSSSTPAVYTGRLEVEASTTCSTTASADIRFKAMTSDYDFGPPELTWNQRCTPRVARDSVYVNINGGRAVTIRRAGVREPGTSFRVVGPTLPLTVQPGGRVWLVVEYAPSTPGTETATLDVDTDAGGGVFSVPLRGRVDAPMMDVAPRAIDAGTVASCEPIRTFPVMVRNPGSSSADVTATAVSPVPGIRIVEGPVVVRAGDSVRLTVEVNPSQLPPGVSRTTFRFDERSCSLVDSVVVTAELLPGDRLVLAPDPVVSATIQRGMVDTMRATITNTGTLPRTIVDLRVDPPTAPFQLISALRNVVVDAGAVVDVVLVFTPQTSGDHAATLTLEDAAQCTTSMRVDLRGRAIEPRVAPTYVLDLRMDEYWTGPETRLVLPVRWLSDIKDADIDSFSMSIQFSALSFTVDSVTAGTMPDVSLTPEWGRGQVDIKAASTGPRCGERGVLAYIHGTAHSAIPDSTALNFAKVVLWATEAVNVNVDPGWIIVDACGPRSMIRIGAMATMRVLPPVPVRDVLAIEFRSGASDIVSVELFDGVGNVVRAFTPITVGLGSGTWTFDVSDLPSGVYGIRCISQHGPPQLVTVPLVR